MVMGETYRVSGYNGIAFYYSHPETEQTEIWEECGEDTLTGEPLGYYDWEECQTGMVVMVMVGDDRDHVIDPNDCVPLSDSDYCSGCGQIGCGWGNA